MRTKLSDFCNRILEAGWLSALIVAPLFFNVYSDRVFEPDKLSLIRSIALVMAAAWLTKMFDHLIGGAESGRKSKEDQSPRPSLWTRITETPLVLPTLLFVLAYVLSTALSVVPRVSFWGSYQRLQGTYTTFSYIIIFFMVLSTLRRREQLGRLINTIIITSLPIAIYGILQHYGRDPLPWGGDTTTRVAANMGNAIFVAAYLIMAIFLTIERLISSFAILMDEERGTISHAMLTGAYMAVLVAQLLAVFFTQSRGPWLGLLAGLYVFVLLGLISLRRRAEDQSPLNGREVAKAAGIAFISAPVGGLPVYAVLAIMKRGLRWMWLSWVIQAVLGMLFLVVFNISGSPLAPLREMPYIGRLGQVFETEGGTGRVRVLIWEGVVDLLQQDAGRTLVGYGPEAMYVAYNPVYPPELAHYEARNASPDRSHNETFDALVMTGVIGFLAYIFLFSSIFYYGLKWLGLIEGPKERNLFIILGVAGALLGVILPRIFEGSFRMAGVGLAAGFILGIIVYLTLSAALPRRKMEAAGSAGQQLLLIALLATIVAHFVEIHFGIAIAATRVYFWVLAAVMVVVGLGRVPLEDDPLTPAVLPIEQQSRKRRKSKKVVPPTPGPQGINPIVSVIAFSLIVALILTVAGYDYITNQAGDRTALSIIWHSLAALVRGPSQFESSFGILGLFILTWIVGGLLTVAGVLAGQSDSDRSLPWGKYLLVYAGISIFVPMPFILWHASRLRPFLSHPANHIDVAYTAVFVLLFLMALALYWEPKRRATKSWGRYGPLSAGLGVLLMAGAFFLISTTNVSVIKADTYYKEGKRADSLRRYDASITYHQKAIDLAPQQDYYYLFLGRSQLEKAQSLADTTQREPQIERSLETLQEAQRLNPLNTDHTANLGRLHRIWAQSSDDEVRRQELFETSLHYYEDAIALSPHNAGLFNEWGLVYYYMGQYDQALEKYEQSLVLDQEFDQTYLLMGDVYLAKQDLERAAELYEKTIELSPNLVQAHSALGYVYAQLGRFDDAVRENLTVLETAPEDYISLRNLTLLYQQAGEYVLALQFAERALPYAPERERAALQQLIEQLRQQVGG